MQAQRCPRDGYEVAPPPFQSDTASTPHVARKRPLLSLPDVVFLVGVLAFHLGLLAWAVAHNGSREPIVTPPSISGFLVSLPAQAEAPPAAQPEPPKPVPQPKPKATPTPPPPKLPPSERAVTLPKAPEPEPTPQEAPTPPAAPAAPATATGPASPPAPQTNSAATGTGPVVPPRADAGYLNNPAPPYPRVSRRLRQEGRVVLHVHILANGRVGELKVLNSSGYPLLDESAASTVRGWTFIPASQGGQAIAYWYKLPIDFNLEKS